MLHPHAELRFASAEKGFGIFAVQDIPKGTIIWVRDPLDHLLELDDAARLPAELRAALSHDYYRVFGGHYLLTHDNARFMNHSCRPTCAHLFDDVEIAIRDIATGDELTNDYAAFTLEEHEEFHCYCADRDCRNWIRRDDPSSQRAYWNSLLGEAWQNYARVEQPLRFLFAQSSIGRASTVAISG